MASYPSVTLPTSNEDPLEMEFKITPLPSTEIAGHWPTIDSLPGYLIKLRGYWSTGEPYDQHFLVERVRKK